MEFTDQEIREISEIIFGVQKLNMPLVQGFRFAGKKFDLPEHSIANTWYKVIRDDESLHFEPSEQVLKELEEIDTGDKKALSWSEEEYEVLREGIKNKPKSMTMNEFFEEVGQKLNRTKSAVGYQYYNVIKLQDKGLDALDNNKGKNSIYPSWNEQEINDLLEVVKDLIPKMRKRDIFVGLANGELADGRFKHRTIEGLNKKWNTELRKLPLDKQRIYNPAKTKKDLHWSSDEEEILVMAHKLFGKGTPANKTEGFICKTLCETLLKSRPYHGTVKKLQLLKKKVYMTLFMVIIL